LFSFLDAFSSSVKIKQRWSILTTNFQFLQNFSCSSEQTCIFLLKLLHLVQLFSVFFQKSTFDRSRIGFNSLCMRTTLWVDEVLRMVNSFMQVAVEYMGKHQCCAAKLRGLNWNFRKRKIELRILIGLKPTWKGLKEIKSPKFGRKII